MTITKLRTAHGELHRMDAADMTVGLYGSEASSGPDSVGFRLTRDEDERPCCTLIEGPQELADLMMILVDAGSRLWGTDFSQRVTAGLLDLSEGKPPPGNVEDATPEEATSSDGCMSPATVCMHNLAVKASTRATDGRPCVLLLLEDGGSFTDEGVQHGTSVDSWQQLYRVMSVLFEKGMDAFGRPHGIPVFTTCSEDDEDETREAPAKH